MDSTYKRSIKKVEKALKRVGVISSDECISGVIEEEGFPDDIFQILETFEKEVSTSIDVKVEIHSRDLYEQILEFVTSANMIENHSLKTEAVVNTKYKTVAKKVKPVATQLPSSSGDHIKKAESEPGLRESRKIGHKAAKSRYMTILKQ